MVNVLMKMLEFAAKNLHTTCDIEIMDIHDRDKLDAPAEPLSRWEKRWHRLRELIFLRSNFTPDAWAILPARTPYTSAA